MTLKAKIDKIEEVEEGYRSLYEEKDGAWVLLPIEGMKPQGEFDTVHNALQKERTDHRTTKTKLTDESKRVLTLEGTNADLTAALEGKGDDASAKIIEQRVQQQVAPLNRKVTDLETRLHAATSEIEGYKGRDSRNTIERAIQKACGTAQIRDTAIEDAVLLGQNIFEIQDGNVITKADVPGITPGVGADVWLTGIKNAKPHWFKESQGGGGGGGGGAGGVNNPWTAKYWNLTEQGKIMRENPDRAKQFAKAAGSEIGAYKPPEGK